MLNPIAQMIIFTMVFGIVLKARPEPGDPSGLDVFALWLACALLPWGFFATAVNTGMGSLAGNAGLVQKVYFPRWILVFANVAAAVVNFGFELIVLVVAVFAFGGNPILQIPLLLVLILLLAVFAFGLALLLSVANVYFRDTTHLMGIVMQVWFYATPIVYPVSLVAASTANHPWILTVYKLNPMEHFVSAFRSLLYDNAWPTLMDMLACLAAAVITFGVGWVVFRAKQGRIAEEL